MKASQDRGSTPRTSTCWPADWRASGVPGGAAIGHLRALMSLDAVDGAVRTHVAAAPQSDDLTLLTLGRVE